MGFFGDLVGGIGDAIGGVTDFVGDIPVIGDLAQKALPIAANFIPGVGPIASAGLGALMNAGGGGGGRLSGAAQGALLGGGAGLLKNIFEQQQADSQRARDLVNSAVERERMLFNRNAPLRSEFRSTALNFFDPTNPFSSGGPITDLAMRRAGIGTGLPGVSQRPVGGNIIPVTGGGGGGQPSGGGGDSPRNQGASRGDLTPTRGGSSVGITGGEPQSPFNREVPGATAMNERELQEALDRSPGPMRRRLTLL